jgi:hypothetical protein
LPEIGSDGDVLLMPYVPKGITGYGDDDDDDRSGYTELSYMMNIHVIHKVKYVVQALHIKHFKIQGLSDG